MDAFRQQIERLAADRGTSYSHLLERAQGWAGVQRKPEDPPVILDPPIPGLLILAALDAASPVGEVDCFQCMAQLHADVGAGAVGYLGSSWYMAGLSEVASEEAMVAAVRVLLKADLWQGYRLSRMVPRTGTDEVTLPVDAPTPAECRAFSRVEIRYFVELWRVAKIGFVVPAHLPTSLPRFGVLLKRLREARWLSQRELATRAGVSESTVRKVEYESHRPIKRMTMLRILRVLQAERPLSSDEELAYLQAHAESKAQLRGGPAPSSGGGAGLCNAEGA
jgi:DNA-binding XRE family transcriptional regulator